MLKIWRNFPLLCSHFPPQKKQFKTIIKLSQMYSQSTVSSLALSKFPKVLEQRGQDGNDMGKLNHSLCTTRWYPWNSSVKHGINQPNKKATPAGPGFHLGTLPSQAWQISVWPLVCAAQCKYIVVGSKETHPFFPCIYSFQISLNNRLSSFSELLRILQRNMLSLGRNWSTP